MAPLDTPKQKQWPAFPVCHPLLLIHVHEAKVILWPLSSVTQISLISNRFFSKATGPHGTKLLYHEREARVIYLRTTDKQTVIHYSTIHALELIYFDSNTQKTMKKHLHPSDSSNFPPLHWRIPQIFLTVIQIYTFISYVIIAQKRRYTI